MNFFAQAMYFDLKLEMMQGKPLLFSTDGKGSSDYWVTVPMTESQIPLPRLSITGNSSSWD